VGGLAVAGRMSAMEAFGDGCSLPVMVCRLAAAGPSFTEFGYLATQVVAAVVDGGKSGAGEVGGDRVECRGRALRPRTTRVAGAG
jgi:hypothetical protein